MRRAFVPLFGLALTAAAVITAALLYRHLPQATPVHFGLDGQADGFVRKPLGPFVFPLTLAALTAAVSILPAISPARFRMDAFASSYRLIACSILALIAWIDAAVTAAGLGAPFDAGRASLVGLGLMLIVVGNVMGKVTPNFFVGVRTPWTLASPEVWRRTHRLAGWLFVGLGALMVLTSAFGVSPMAPLLAVLVAAGGLVLYSYVIYRRIGSSEGDR